MAFYFQISVLLTKKQSTMTDSQFEESLDQYFAIESEELIQTIEQTLVSLLEEKTVERVHTLMRAAHTIKGGAANCGLKTIETIAHHLEDVFQALYPEELIIDDELGALLLEGYEVLYTPLSAILSGYKCDDEQILEQTADLFARLQAKLGDFFGREAPLPTAEDLGFDVVGLIFGDSVPEDLNQLAASLATGDTTQIRQTLITQSEFFIELGASYALPGIEEIAKTTLRAIELYPDHVVSIGQVALANLQVARTEILAGDRELGGTVSPELLQWISDHPDLTAVATPVSNTAATTTPDEIATPVETSLDYADLLGETATGNSDAGDLFDLLSERSADNNDADDLFDLLDEPTAVTSNSDANDLFDLLSEKSVDNNDADDLFDLLDEPTAATSNSDANDLFDLLDEPAAVNSDATELLDLLDVSSTTDEVIVSAEITPDLINAELIDVDVIDLQPLPTNEVAGQPESSAMLAVSNFAEALDVSHQQPQLSPIDQILQSISTHIPEAQPPQAPPAPSAPNTSAPTIRVAIDRLDRLSHAVGELLIDENQHNSRNEKIHRLSKDAIEELGRAHYQLGQIRDWSDKNLLHTDRAAARPAAQNSPFNLINNQAGFDVLEMDVYSDLHILIQKLSDHMDGLGEQLERLESSTQKLQERQGKRKQIFAVAQDELLQARMEPISTVFDRFPRLVQQMVTKHKKPAELLLGGTSVLVDRATVDKLYDPLLHLIRNSYDHGLEVAATREAKGKRSTGQIVVTAYHHGNRTTIEVRDDGGGLNFDRIRQKGIEQNLISAAQAQVASETELADLLFHPGFSTADKVSELSGRGIGLDVVRTQIEALNGSITVQSVAGKGTTFSLQIPLNFTTARLMICEVQGQTYGLLSDSLRQVILPQPAQLQHKTSTGEGAQVFYRYTADGSEKLMAVQGMADLLSYNCPVKSVLSTTGKFSLLMVEVDGQRLCLAVDRILSEQELAISPLGNAFALPSYVQGYSTLSEGNLTLAIDPVELLSRSRMNPVASSFAAAAPAVNRQQLNASAAAPDSVIEAELLPDHSVANNQITVLIIDDSLVQRQSLLRTLSGAGYQVLQAANGQEGLVQLNKHTEIQVVVCDIEMPFMNGFEFLSYCRQDARLSQIPTIMLTTRSGAKHRQLAIALGARGYTTKPHADHELLAAVEKMLQVPVLV
jgi:two-component system, chemotaxis family, sensor histidine kinase and response regulator PixL